MIRVRVEPRYLVANPNWRALSSLRIRRSPPPHGGKGRFLGDFHAAAAPGTIVAVESFLR